MGTKKLISPKFYKDKKSTPSGAEVIDIYDSARRELFLIEYPNFKTDSKGKEDEIKKYLSNRKVKDVWIYFPWRNILLRTVEENIFLKLRTARNRNVITAQEQQKYRGQTIGIIGLSIGSVILSSLVATGGPKTIKLSDYDDIEITNLNRMKATVFDVLQNKAIVTAQKTWELDPFAELDVWDYAVTKKNIEKKRKLSAVVLI